MERRGCRGVEGERVERVLEGVFAVLLEGFSCECDGFVGL